MKKPVLLKNIDIQFISLVPNGANRRQIIAKSKSQHKVVRQIAISKQNVPKQMVYGIVCTPDEVDTQGEYTTIAEIEKAQQRFMRNLSLRNIDVDHSYVKAEAYVAESWLIRKGDPMFPNERVGAWAVGIKVEGPKLWEKVRKGKIKALSMGGIADKVITKQDERRNNMDAETFAKFQEALTALFTEFGIIEKPEGNAEGTDGAEGAEDNEDASMNKASTDAIIKAVTGIVKPLKEAVEKAGKTTSSMEARLKKLEGKSAGSIQDNQPVDKSGTSKTRRDLGAEIAKSLGVK